MAYSSKGQKMMRIIGSKSYIISNIYWKSKIIFIILFENNSGKPEWYGNSF